MQKENLTETALSVEAPAPGEQAGSASSVETPTSGKRTRTAVPVVPVETPVTVGVKIATRLDALKEYVLGYMDTERFRNANLTESGSNDLRNVLDESEQVLNDLRRIAGRAGLERWIAELEIAAVFLEFPDYAPAVLTPEIAVLDVIVANRKKIVTRLDALRQSALNGMGMEQAEPILEDLRYVAEYTGLEEEIAWREEAAVCGKPQCPFCGSPNVGRAEKSGNGTQRYFCRNPACSHKTFQLEYRYMAYSPGVREKALQMLMSGSSKSDTGRALNISCYAVNSVLKRHRKLPEQ